VDFDILSNQ